MPGEPPKNVSKIISKQSVSTILRENELIQLDTENENKTLEIEDDDLRKIQKSESNSNPDRIEFESRSPEMPKLEEPIQSVLKRDNTDEITLDVGMDDEKTNDSNNITNNKMDPLWVLESPMLK